MALTPSKNSPAAQVTTTRPSQAMRVAVEPMLRQWGRDWIRDDRSPTVVPPVAADGENRAALSEIAARRAAMLGSSLLDAHKSIIATGHQAWLWHPGILAKNLAVRVACDRLHASPLHLIVDQDAHEALSVDVPVVRDGALSVHTLKLGLENAALPTASQPAIDPATAVSAIQRAQHRLGSVLAVDLEPLRAAWDRAPCTATLAQQLAAVTRDLLEPLAGATAMILATDLPGLPAFGALLRDMIQDAAHCVAHYNAATAQVPEARVAALVATRERVELPVWLLSWRGPRRRLFADLSDSTPLLTLEDGSPVDVDALIEASARASQSSREPAEGTLTLAPRALLLTAVMRSVGCDLFVHGQGGGKYDRITEQWWQSWRHQSLAPMAVATADLRLDLNVPVGDEAGVARAVWAAHHLPHNVDRVLSLSEHGELVQSKRAAMSGIASSPRRSRDRRAWFRKLHEANAALASAHEPALREVELNVTRANQALANGRIASRRDWCFALYPETKLRQLAAMLSID
jgi:hypothetical protein